MLWTATIDPENPQRAFDALVDAWQSDDYRVFVLRGGSEPATIRDFYTRWFPSIGTPVALAEDVTVGDRDNQRSGEIWTEVRYDPAYTDAYRHSANPQPLHTDGSYIPSFPNATLMACVANAGEGGETTFISSEDVIAALAKEEPELLDHLSGRAISHARSGDERVEKIVDRDHVPPLVNWNYYCLSAANDAADKAATQAFFDYLQSSSEIARRIVPVKLGPGDAVTWKDRQVLHGRNGFSATQASERFLWKCAVDVANFGG
jgi:alpha-ketoglutarate-dependent taurine dioxygenase